MLTFISQETRLLKYRGLQKNKFIFYIKEMIATFLSPLVQNLKYILFKEDIGGC